MSWISAQLQPQPQPLLFPQPQLKPFSVPKSRIRMIISQSRLLLFPQNMMIILSPCMDFAPAGHGNAAGQEDHWSGWGIHLRHIMPASGGRLQRKENAYDG